jgi:hypothetical protein
MMFGPMNNVSQLVVCMGNTCRKGELCIYSVFRCIPSQRNDLLKKQVRIDPQSRSPEQKNRISSDRTEETVIKKSKRKERLPLRPNGTPASQRYSVTPRNALEHGQT